MVERDPSKFKVRVRFPHAAPNRRKMSEPIYELTEMSTYYTTTNQAQAEQAIANKHYIIGSVDQYGGFSISANPAIHKQLHAANAEAKRLAGNMPGKTFVVLQLASGYRVGGILEF